MLKKTHAGEGYLSPFILEKPRYYRAYIYLFCGRNQHIIIVVNSRIVNG
jgi:hypothetical protein